MSDVGEDARKYLRQKNDRELERKLKNLELDRQSVKRASLEVGSDEREVKKALERIEARERQLTSENTRRNGFYSF
jgi:septal ring factor EnvC (AmiA/AmiB activator)